MIDTPPFDRPLISSSRTAGAASSVPNALLFREVNERLLLEYETSDSGPTFLAICECDSRSCQRRVRVSVSEYEDVRRFPTRFLVVSGHSTAADERAVECRPAFDIVEKVGDSARAAILLDPRKPQHVVGSSAG